MELIQKIWFRIVISLFGGGLVSEIIHISTGDPNRPVSDNSKIMPLVYAIIIYFIMTSLLKKNGKIK